MTFAKSKQASNYENERFLSLFAGKPIMTSSVITRSHSRSFDDSHARFARVLVKLELGCLPFDLLWVPIVPENVLSPDRNTMTYLFEETNNSKSPCETPWEKDTHSQHKLLTNTFKNATGWLIRDQKSTFYKCRLCITTTTNLVLPGGGVVVKTGYVIVSPYYPGFFSCLCYKGRGVY